MLKPGAGGGAFRKNALFVNPASSAIDHHHPSLGFNNSDSEALYYDDFAHPLPPAPAATRPR